MKILLYILTFLTVTLTAHGQISSGGIPYRFNASEYGTVKRAPAGKFSCLGAYGSFFTTLDVDTVRREPENNGFKCLYVGNTCKLDLTPENSGTVYSQDGNLIWRTGVTSAGAKSIGLVFTEFNIPQGARLFIYNPSQSVILGAFTADNNNCSNILPVQPLAADSLVVEYVEPTDGGKEFKGVLRIGEASHNFYDIGELRRANPGKGNICTPHVNQWAYGNPVKDASCALYITGTSGSWFGSGTLINNTNHKPYVISAAHLLDDVEWAKKTVFYFQYQTPVQDTLVIGSMELTIAGAVTRAYKKDIDMLLMELNQTPPQDYRPYMAGWDLTSNPSSPVCCIQHPNGDFTKISTSYSTPQKSYISFSRDVFPYESFWRVSRWNKGTTQAGSSGSPLLDANNRIIGTLTGGASTCTSPINDYFSQISAQYNFNTAPSESLKTWLDPASTGITQMDGEYLYKDHDACTRLTNTSDGDILDAYQLDGAYQGYQAGDNNLGFYEYGERYTFDEDMTIGGVYVMTCKGLYRAEHPVYLNIYRKNDGGAFEKVSSTVVKPTDYMFTYSGELKSSIFTNWTKREIYVRLAEPVRVGEECMIGVQFEQATGTKDTLALYQTVNRTGGSYNTAYYKNSNSWKPFTEYPTGAMPASLWIEPVAHPSNGTPATEAEADVTKYKFSVFPNPSNGSTYLHALSSSVNAVSFRLSDISGRTLQSKTIKIDGEDTPIQLPEAKGVYLITIFYGGEQEVHKIIRR